MALYALTGHVAAGYGNLYLHLPIESSAIGLPYIQPRLVRLVAVYIFLCTLFFET